MQSSISSVCPGAVSNNHVDTGLLLRVHRVCRLRIKSKRISRQVELVGSQCVCHSAAVLPDWRAGITIIRVVLPHATIGVDDLVAADQLWHLDSPTVPSFHVVGAAVSQYGLGRIAGRSHVCQHVPRLGARQQNDFCGKGIGNQYCVLVH